MNLGTLIQTLEAEVGIYKDFKEIEEGKTAVIIDGDIEKLDEILNTEHMMHMKLQSVEKKRIETMKTLGLAGKTLAGVIELADGGEQKILSDILEGLISHTDALKQINDYNTKLVMSRLEVISSVTKLFGEASPGSPASGAQRASKTSKIESGDKIYGRNAKVLEQPGKFGASVISKKI
ncbi:MAG: flagellar protein FlgN [Oscillospiraceae bacterium]|nr:flagellar protein FlgN [Oscillospiraceae bacterium]